MIFTKFNKFFKNLLLISIFFMLDGCNSILLNPHGKIAMQESSILLISSYILFGVSSIIFINTCIHFNKASMEDIVNVVKDPAAEKPILINQPIFEYLKPINYLSIDNFLLYYNNINTPFFWVFSIIIFFSLICVAGNIFYWWFQDGGKNYKIWKYELFGDFSKIISFIIVLIPYIYIFIISSTFNSEQNKIIARLNNVNISGRQYKGFEEFKPQLIKKGNFLNELKKIIIHCINNEIKHKDIHLMLTGTYKEEYGDGSHGWHVERGAPVKPIGGRILDIRCDEYEKDKKTFITKIVDSRKFPI
jgi:hypothetical protein